ncbi:MAG: hypothetical protein J0H68_07435 [Sphingobacteriia bacterium]|nr:hypothetical protein [Sphingobacteriia bacterium]
MFLFKILKILIFVSLFISKPINISYANEDIFSILDLPFQMVETILDNGEKIIFGGAELVIDSIENTVDGMIVVLKDAKTSNSATIKFFSDTNKAINLVVGHTVKVVETSSGMILETAGKAIAFIPNEMAK